DTAGKWRLPGSRERETPTVSAEQAPGNSEARTAIVPPNLAASPPSAFTPVPLLSPGPGAIAKFPTSQAGLAPEVQRVNIEGGNFAMRPETEDSPFSASVTVRNVQADQIVTDAGGPKGMVQGKLEGEFEASGKTADPDALIGKGEIFLRDGRVQQYSLLVAIGQILQIEELTELRLEQAQAKYHVNPGLVTIDELILRSPNVRLSASGTITFDGRLKLDSQLAINEKIRGQLFRAIRDNFQPSSDPGYFALNFQVGGSVDRPRTNLMDKLVGR